MDVAGGIRDGARYCKIARKNILYSMMLQHFCGRSRLIAAIKQYAIGYPAVLMLAGLLVTACSHISFQKAPPTPGFTEAPALELDPNLTTPLAALLTLATDIPTRLEVTISDSSHSHVITFNEFETSHSHPVLGLKPDRTYSVSVTAVSRQDARITFAEKLELATDPLPEGFPQIVTETSKPDAMEPGYTVFDVIPEGNNAEFGALIVIVDEVGEVVWYQVGSRYTDVRQNDNGHLYFLEGGKFIEMDMLGNRVREWKAVGNSRQKITAAPVATPSFHHEVHPMENGNFLALSIEARTYDAYPTSVSNPDAPTATSKVAGDVVVEFAPDGHIVHQWSLLDILDPYRIGYGSLGPYWDSFFNDKTRDWSHANAVVYDAKDDAIIAALRHQDTIVKFRRNSGQLIWILSPPDNWDMESFGSYLLKPANETEHFFPYHAHAPMLLPNGNLMVYDNGNNRASAFSPKLPDSENFSRAVEYAINEQTMEAEIVWQYGINTDPRYYSAALGDADLLPQTDNVLITHGNIYSRGNKLAARIIEVTHTTPAHEVFNLVVKDNSEDPEAGWRVYRSERITSLYPPSQ
jgi:hypothetical protein